MRRLTLWLIAGATVVASEAWACTNPAGVAGHIVYNSSVNALQFCDGTDWVNLNTVSPTAPNTGCANPVGARGQIIFNATQKTHQVCNGSQWADTSCGSAVTAGSSCTNPNGVAGDMIRATVSGTEALFSCGGASWARMGLPCVGLASPNISQLFATTLYTGAGAGTVAVSGIDLQGRGGLAWIKRRNGFVSHYLVDTARGGNSLILSNGSDAATVVSSVLTFSTNGITANYNDGGYSVSGGNFALWSFAESPRFFDIVTYTGDGTTGRQIPHNLNNDVGMVIFKRTDSTGNWIVWHRSLQGYTNPYLRLNGAFPTTSLGQYGNTITPTTAHLLVSTHSNGGNTADNINLNGASYVAYAFANDTAADGVIQCGGFSHSNGTPTTVTLGWQPQWIMYKASSVSYSWMIYDTVRGITSGTNSGPDSYVTADTAEAEATHSGIDVLSTGFRVPSGQTSGEWIYCAIRAP